MLVLGQRHAAQGGSGANANLRMRRFIRAQRQIALVRIFESHLRGDQRELRESVQALHAPRWEISQRIEVGHFAGDLGIEGGCIETRETANTRLTAEDSPPEPFLAAADCGNRPDSCDDDTLRHGSSG